ncbi:MAG: NUDIX hydrolase [Nitrososphaerota archaeon]
MTRNRYAVAAASALVKRGEGVLLVKRGSMPAKGKWALPGGSVKWGEPIRETVRREVFEETGVRIEVSDLVDVVDVIVRSEAEVQYHYVVICFRGHYLGGELRPGTDAEDARWVQVNNLKDFELTPTVKMVLAKELGIRL